jgi:hypothetical protein
MKKFEYEADIGYFTIDPAHLAAGLAAAAAKKYTAVRVMAMDYRDTKLGFDPAAFAGQTWLRKLVLDEDLTPKPAGMAVLQQLTGLEELSMPAWVDLDYAAFSALQTLVLSGASALRGIAQARRLQCLYLIDWQGAALPKEISAISAPQVRISASRKLTSVDALFQLDALRDLTLQDLPKLAAPDKALRLNGLVRLHLEGLPWRDFGFLHSQTLEELEMFNKFDSLAFIRQLPALKRLAIWECVDGDMNPVLAHPALREIYMDKSRKHYTHKEKALQAALSERG